MLSILGSEHGLAHHGQRRERSLPQGFGDRFSLRLLDPEPTESPEDAPGPARRRAGNKFFVMARERSGILDLMRQNRRIVSEQVQGRDVDGGFLPHVDLAVVMRTGQKYRTMGGGEGAG